MKTHLIFKRTENIEGVSQVVTKIIPVEVPYINRGEGWILSGHADVVDIVKTSDSLQETFDVSSLNNYSIPLSEQTIETLNIEKDDIVKFESSVKGTAKLVRSKGVIKIVARRGKTTYNQTTPNSVCINDFTKNEFFKSCREYFGPTACFEFKIQDKPYDYWNDVIDKEYQRQKNLI